MARAFRSGGPDGPVVSGYAVIFQRPDGGYGVSSVNLGEPLVQPVDVAVDAPAELGFVAALGGPSTVPPQLIIFNRAGLPTVRGRVRLPGNPHGVAVLPGTGIAYVATDAGLCLVDGRSETLELTIPLDRGPTSIAVDPATGVTYVGDRFEGSVTRIDTAAILG